MTKGGIIFGLAAGGTLGLFSPRLIGQDGLGIGNLVMAVLGAILGLIGVAVYVRYVSNRVR